MSPVSESNPSNQQPAPGAIQDVIAKAYAAIVEPERLLELIDDVIEAQADHEDLDEATSLHFENAFEILDKLYPLNKADFAALKTHADAAFECDLALGGGHDGSFEGGMRVITFNQALFEDDGLSAQSSLPHWLFDPVSEKRDIERLKRLGPDSGKLFVRLFLSHKDENGRWFSAEYQKVKSDSFIALDAVRLRWDPRCGHAFKTGLELTDTELELTRHLVTGGNMRGFAEKRGRAIGTVRNQMKQLQRKLSINSKEDLLLLYAGFAHSLDPPNESGASIQHRCRNLFTSPAGKTIAWEEYGDPKGYPVLYFHALEGPLVTAKVRERAAHFGLRLIGPWRPHYGDTSGCSKPGPQTPVQFAARLPEWLDHLGIDRCAALGTQAGTPYMMAFGAGQPDRISAAVAAGPFFPVVTPRDYEFMPKRQRTHYRISRVAPAMARIYMRGMLASMGTGEFHRFVEDYYEGCPRELSLVQRPDMNRNFQRAANYVLPGGPDGPIDTMLNWSAAHGGLHRSAAQAIGGSIRVLVGESDSNTPPDFAKLSCQQLGLPAPLIVPDAGSFLIEEKTDIVFAAIKEAAGI